MAQNVAEAIEEVTLIKRVIDRTQNDFSRIADFFIAIGIVNVVTYLLYAYMLQLLNGADHVPYFAWCVFRGLKYVSVAGYGILFYIYRRRLKNWNNHLSVSLINIWGVLLIGGEIFRLFFAGTYFGEQDAYFFQRTLTFLFPLIGCFIMGFVIQDKLIVWAASAVGILYMCLAALGIAVTVADFHGNAVKTGLDVLLTAAVVSVGMILLGVELKRKGER